MGMLLPIEIDTEHYEVLFDPENAEEQPKIAVHRWQEGKLDSNNRISFDLAAKGLVSDFWPPKDRRAAQFYRRARQASDQRFFIDAFVNYYFYLERLYAGGKFKSAEVANRFASQPDFQEAFSKIVPAEHKDAIKRGVPLNGDLTEFCKWMVSRRGFFQHQSETDPNRWLHSTQEEFSSEAGIMAGFAMSVYYIRNADRVFNEEMNRRWVDAAIESRATMKIQVTIFGEDPSGKPVRKAVNVDGPGTTVTNEMAQEVLLKCMKLADEQLISVRQMTAAVKDTHELIFSYSGPAQRSA
jgi:hypothetical protein